MLGITSDTFKTGYIFVADKVNLVVFMIIINHLHQISFLILVLGIPRARL